jgi:hypothetical protein
MGDLSFRFRVHIRETLDLVDMITAAMLEQVSGFSAASLSRFMPLRESINRRRTDGQY